MLGELISNCTHTSYKTIIVGELIVLSIPLRWYYGTPETWFGGDVCSEWCGYWSKCRSYRPKIRTCLTKRQGTEICNYEAPSPLDFSSPVDLFVFLQLFLCNSVRKHPKNVEKIARFPDGEKKHRILSRLLLSWFLFYPEKSKVLFCLHVRLQLRAILFLSLTPLADNSLVAINLIVCLLGCAAQSVPGGFSAGSNPLRSKPTRARCLPHGI